MNGEKSRNNRKDSIIEKLGLCSLLIGIFFWLCTGIFSLDPFSLVTYLWDTLAVKLDDGYGIGGWILVVFVIFVFPAVTHSIGLLFGLVGLWTPKRTFAVLGLMVNAILPILLFLSRISNGS